MKIVWSWCDRVISGPIIGIEGGDEVKPLICNACFHEVFEEGNMVDISKAYELIQAKSGRYIN